MVFPIFVPGAIPPPPEPIAETIAFTLGLPDGACVGEVIIRPTGNVVPWVPFGDRARSVAAGPL
jgi:hypothetical protein